MSGRVIVVGDIHGCVPELLALILKLEPVASLGDRFVFVGDVVDKGPDSLGALHLVQEIIAKYPGSVCIAGNHEEKALKLLHQGQPERGEAWLLNVTAEDKLFMASMPLIHRIDDWDKSAMAVHAGILPSYFKHHGRLPDAYPADWHRGGGKRMERARRFLHVRGVDADGEMADLYEPETSSARHWSEVYQGEEGFVIFGHQPTFNRLPMESPHATGIDLGCVHGVALAAAVLEPGYQYPRIVAVPAAREYAPRWQPR